MVVGKRELESRLQVGRGFPPEADAGVPDGGEPTIGVVVAFAVEFARGDIPQGKSQYGRILTQLGPYPPHGGREGADVGLVARMAQMEHLAAALVRHPQDAHQRLDGIPHVEEGAARMSAVHEIQRLPCHQGAHEAGEDAGSPFGFEAGKVVHARTKEVEGAHDGPRQIPFASVGFDETLEELLGAGVAPARTGERPQQERCTVFVEEIGFFRKRVRTVGQPGAQGASEDLAGGEMHQTLPEFGAQPHHRFRVQEVRLDHIDRARAVEARIAQGGEVHHDVRIADVGFEQVAVRLDIVVSEAPFSTTLQMARARAVAIPTRDAEVSLFQQTLHEMRADESICSQNEDMAGCALLKWHGTPTKIGPYLSLVRHAPTILLFCFAALALSFPLSDTDIWWHLAAGRTIVGTLSWLRTDPFCASSLGEPWIDLHWGFQLLVFSWQRLGGDASLIALRIVLYAATLWISLRGRMGWGPAILATLLVFQTRTFLDLRPLLVSLVALALLWTLLEKEPSPARFAGAIVLQILLANTQGLFLLGPLFALASGVGAVIEGRRRVAIAQLGLVLALGVASLANPWGWHAFDLAGKVAGRIVPSAANLFSREIPENLPLPLWFGENIGHALILAWIAVFAWIFRRKGAGSPGRILLLTGTGILACMAVRNLPLFGLALLFAVEPRRLRIPSFAPIACLAITAVLTAPLLLERRWNDPSSPIAPLRLPSQRILNTIMLEPSPVFHEIRAGGWLSWHLPSPGACWCDTRLVLHDQAFVADYLDVLARPERFEAWSQERGFRFALLPIAEIPHATAFAVSLFASSSWKLVDCDGAWALFARSESAIPEIDWRSPTGRATIEAATRERLGDNPRLARFATARLGEILEHASVSSAGEIIP